MGVPLIDVQENIKTVPAIKSNPPQIHFIFSAPLEAWHLSITQKEAWHLPRHLPEHLAKKEAWHLPAAPPQSTSPDALVKKEAKKEAWHLYRCRCCFSFEPMPFANEENTEELGQHFC